MCTQLAPRIIRCIKRIFKQNVLPKTLKSCLQDSFKTHYWLDNLKIHYLAAYTMYTKVFNKFLNENNRLYQKQNGFPKKNSTTDAVTEFITDTVWLMTIVNLQQVYLLILIRQLTLLITYCLQKKT